MPFARRQLVTAALVANAVRPLRGQYSAIPGFFAGWLTTELAPQLLLLTLADTAVSAARGRAGRLGVTLAGASAVGLGAMIVNATLSATYVETTLRDGLGTDYLDELDDPVDAEDVKLSLQ